MVENAKIIVVEDEGIVAEDIYRSLENMGYHVVDVVSSGKQALKKIAECMPDLVLMDIVLRGELDGIETSRRIRGQYDVPVVYLTAYADRDTLEKAKRTEPYGYLLKPFDDQELRITIEMALYKHRMERTLKEREAYFSTILKSIIDGVITTDEKGNITFMNPVAEAMTGYGLKDVFQKPIDNALHFVDEHTGKDVKKDLTQILNQGNIQPLCRNVHLRHLKQHAIPVENLGAPIKNERHEIIGAVVILQDITEKRKVDLEKERIRQELMQAQKMEAIGRLAGGIAHDFNTLLTAIMGFTDMALLHLDDSEEAFSEIQQVKFAAKSAADLTRQLLLFSQRHPLEFKPTQLNTPLADILKIIKRLIGENIHIHTDLDTQLWPVLGDKGSLEQVVMNLAVNAKDAMPDGGKLTIRTQNVALNEDAVQGIDGARPGRFASLSISDTGIGISEEIIHRIFEPFFSTKEAFEGTGLGLSVVYGIVKEHDGWMRVITHAGRGTTFNIYLPAIDAQPVTDPSRPAKIRGKEKRFRRILVVEDQRGAKEFTCKALERLGYTVFGADSAKEALSLVKKQGAKLNMVLSDVELPDQTGIDLVEQVRAIIPDIAIVLCSGYTDEKSRWPIIRKKGYRFLQKPYGFEDLAALMFEMFETKN